MNGDLRDNLTIASGPDEAAMLIAREINRAGKESVDLRGRFLLAVPGGTTVVPIFNELVRSARSDSIPWGFTHLFWVDERAVPPDHEDSNYRLAKELLLDRIERLPSSNVHRIRGELGADRAAAEYNNELRSFIAEFKESTPRGMQAATFDLTLLGVGDDGHIASLFPGSPLLDDQSLEGPLALAVHDASRSPAARITLSLAAINASRRIIIAAFGESKARAVAAGVEHTDPTRPVAMVNAGVHGDEVLWIIDEPAAGLLQSRQGH